MWCDLSQFSWPCNGFWSYLKPGIIRKPDSVFILWKYSISLIPIAMNKIISYCYMERELSRRILISSCSLLNIPRDLRYMVVVMDPRRHILRIITHYGRMLYTPCLDVAMRFLSCCFMCQSATKFIGANMVQGIILYAERRGLVCYVCIWCYH